MDFFNIKTKENRNGTIEVYPNFLVGRSKDLMVKAKSFYAIWDEEKGLWSTDEYDVQRLVDRELTKFVDENEGRFVVKYMRNFDSNQWTVFRKYVQNISDSSKTLDNNLVFSNQETTKEDYATKKLPYPLEEGSHDAWDKIVSTLYDPEERRKIEWAIGAIVSGDARYIQKFMVLYGPSGTGKSTIMNIVLGLFEGYTATFNAKALGSGRGDFATAAFKDNPLVAIQQDGDLSKIEDNTQLNSIVSHEDIRINEKNKPEYTARINAFLFMGTNNPVKISDAKSGLIRRLIDVEPTGKVLPSSEYTKLTNQVKFEHGAIAKHCLDVYTALGPHYYDDYRPIKMMYQTDHVLNFVSDNFDIFSSQEYTTITQANAMYKDFCDEYGIDKPLQRQKLQSELSNYFGQFHARARFNGEVVRGAFTDFDIDKVKPAVFEPNKVTLVQMSEGSSIFDREYADQPAQLASESGTPRYSWRNVDTKLSDLDTSELHYVQVPENHIVIDFDLKDENGEKSLERNLEEASKWPVTYSEVSKSGGGVHLHYIFDGDVDTLAPVYDEDIEIKVYKGNSSLRRKLTKRENNPIAHISSGLPTKEKKVLSEKTVRSEKGLRDLISRNLRKEILPGTKPSVDFIKKILDDAYESDLQYDVTDMRSAIFAFASKSTNQALGAIKQVQNMKFSSENTGEVTEETTPVDDRSLIFFDVEVYPNLFLVVWKRDGDDAYSKMINPTPQEIEELMRLKLVGFNNRRYDNHMLYARFMGYDNQALYNMSRDIVVNNNRNALFGEAYNLSHADIYDFASKKQSLKKWEIELGLNHVEMDIPWDQPVPDEKLLQVVDYCCNDVMATEAVFHHLKADYMAREILADLSGLSVNHTTQNHTARIIFGNERTPQKQFVYTDLATGERSDGKVDDVKFDGYIFDMGKSTYKGEDPSEGGYVYAEPGIHENVAVLDVSSMHPTSIRQLDAFGPYTKNFGDLVDARLAIKRREFDKARAMLDGKLTPYLKEEDQADKLSYALKIVINIVYGLTSAKFENKFRDNRNKDNIVAKRGALFMIDLKEAVQKEGYTVAHIKTDSIKIPNADDRIIKFVEEFGEKYGYNFEHEETFDKFCLVNDAVYVARTGDKWDATGAQFQHPIVFKTLFDRDQEIEMIDYSENRSVQKGHIYLAMDGEDTSDEDLIFVGKTGSFTPVKPETDGAGHLYRLNEGKRYAVSGTKGYIWTETRLVDDYDLIDTSYSDELVENARKTIEKYGSYEELVS